MGQLPSRVRDHIAAFNAAVASDRWDEFVATFHPQAEMIFVGVPVGPYSGRAAIEAAYRDRPPTDTIVIDSCAAVDNGAVADDHDEVRFRWSDGSLATMALDWRDGSVKRLEVIFESADHQS